jgi:hypothetical protein
MMQADRSVPSNVAISQSSSVRPISLVIRLLLVAHRCAIALQANQFSMDIKTSIAPLRRI